MAFHEESCSSSRMKLLYSPTVHSEKLEHRRRMHHAPCSLLPTVGLVDGHIHHIGNGQTPYISPCLRRFEPGIRLSGIHCTRKASQILGRTNFLYLSASSSSKHMSICMYIYIYSHPPPPRSTPQVFLFLPANSCRSCLCCHVLKIL